MADSTAASSAEISSASIEEVDTVQDKSSLQVFSAVMSNLLLFFLIFCLSATVNLHNLQEQFHNRFALGTGVMMQFLIMPFLGFVAVSMLDHHDSFTQAMGLTLLVVTASPGGSFSNWWCSTFNAELALSVAMTTVSSVLSIALLPANLLLYSWLAYGRDSDSDENGATTILQALDFGTLFITLGIVMGAIGAGLYCGHRWDSPCFHITANRVGTVCGVALILFSLFLSSNGGDSSFWNQEWPFYVGVAFPCLVGMALANVIARSLKLSRPETVAISIECCYQNVGIATSVAITMFTDPDEQAQAIAVPLYYGFVEAVAIGLYCLWAWKVGWTKAPKDENICVVISKTYEVVVDQDEDDEPDTDDDEGDEVEPSTSQFTEDPEAVVEVATGDASRRASEKTVQTVGTGFWARIFPPVLVRGWSSLWPGSTGSESSSDGGDSSAELEAHESADECFFELPDMFPKADSSEPWSARKRLNTAETTQTASSTGTPLSPASPGADDAPGRQVMALSPSTASLGDRLPVSIPELVAPRLGDCDSENDDTDDADRPARRDKSESR